MHAAKKAIQRKGLMLMPHDHSEMQMLPSCNLLLPTELRPGSLLLLTYRSRAICCVKHHHWYTVARDSVFCAPGRRDCSCADTSSAWWRRRLLLEWVLVGYSTCSIVERNIELLKERKKERNTIYICSSCCRSCYCSVLVSITMVHTAVVLLLLVLLLLLMQFS